MCSVRLFRSSALRLAVVHVALFGGSAVVLLVFIYWSTAGYMLRQADETMQAEITGLAERYRVSGLRGLTALIDDRLAREPAGSALYLVANAAYRPVLGNLSRWPQVPADADGWLNFRLDSRPAAAAADERETTHWARARSFRLEGGYQLLAGRDMYELQVIRATIATTMAWGVGLTVVLSLVGGVVLSRGRIRRVGVINDALADAMAGHLSRRIPPDPTGDDIEQLAERFNLMLDEFEKLLDGVRRVSDNIAHDLRTPLARLRARLEQLRQPQNEEARHDIAEAAVDDAEGLLSTFNALLRIARIESRGRRQEFKSFSVTAAVEDVAELYGPLLEDAGLRLEMSSEPDLELTGDRDLVFQAVANLLDNALKHVPEGGRVSIGASRRGDIIQLGVADDGPGIPASERERVLERFYRLEASRSTPGAGLGLSLVAAVAELHQATLALQDNAPGLRVVLRFPTDGRHVTASH